jgi:hypothetical protein
MSVSQLAFDSAPASLPGIGWGFSLLEVHLTRAWHSARIAMPPMGTCKLSPGFLLAGAFHCVCRS